MTIPIGQPHLLTADAIAPMDPGLPPVLFNAGIVITAGRIAAIGDLAELRRTFGELSTTHHPGLMLPGLINAHTHLELSHLSAGKLKAENFTQWVSGLMANRPPPDQLEAITRAAFNDGLKQSLAAGVTTLGDISRNVTITRDEYNQRAKDALLPRIVSYGEVMGLGKMRDRIIPTLDAATQYPRTTNPVPPPTPTDHGPQTTNHESRITAHDSRLIVGISPHAPYTVEGPALRAAVRRAIVKRLPLCMHLAELSEEAQFLTDLSGPLGHDSDFIQKLGILDDQIPTYSGGPIRWAQLHGLLVTGPRDLPVLLAHVNYCDNAELAQLAASSASIAYCPRTRHYFGHDTIVPHRYRDMLAAGINVCLGTDSLASNPDLNLLKEAQLLHQRDKLDPLTALSLITRRAALALGLADQIGTLAPNKSADLVMYPVEVNPSPPPETLFSNLLHQAPLPHAIYLAGQRQLNNT